MVHLPRFASPAFDGKSKNGLYGDIVEELDWSVGQILDTLKALELDRRTVVVFFSDNGGTRDIEGYEVSNAPLRGRKGSMFEGGFRVCSLAWAPGLIPPGATTDEVVTSMDLLPTFANLGKASAPTDRVIDGIDVTRVLQGDETATGLRESFFFYRGSVLFAARSGPWKLFVKDYQYAGSTVHAGTLYNLTDDIAESKDRSSEFPGVVKRIQKLADKARRELGDGPDNPGSGVRRAAYIDIDDAKTLTQRPLPWPDVTRRN
jgi:arylsulfatase A